VRHEHFPEARVSGAYGSPYRAPCAGWTGGYWLGAPWQHYRPGDSAIPVLHNITLIPNWEPPPANVPPWTKPTCDDAVFGEPCGPWDFSDFAASASDRGLPFKDIQLRTSPARRRASPADENRGRAEIESVCGRAKTEDLSGE